MERMATYSTQKDVASRSHVDPILPGLLENSRRRQSWWPIPGTLQLACPQKGECSQASGGVPIVKLRKGPSDGAYQRNNRDAVETLARSDGGPILVRADGSAVA